MADAEVSTRVFGLPQRPKLAGLAADQIVGRASSLAQLHKILTATEPSAGNVLAVNGLGGVGKTTLAIEYCYTLARQHFDLIWWVNAASEVNIIDSVRSLLEAVGVSPDELRLVEQVREYLETAGTWLLVLDDLNEPDAIRRWVPSTRTGRVLITTRIASGWDNNLDLGVLDQGAARDWILRAAGSPEDPAEQLAAEHLVGRLDGLPLAISMAAAFIANRGVSIQEFLGLVDRDQEGASGELQQPFLQSPIQSPSSPRLATRLPISSEKTDLESEPVIEDMDPDDEVHQIHDRATEQDLLGRSRLAGTLAGQIWRLHGESPDWSYSIHISGEWGSGKSTLVNLMVRSLRNRGATDWILPEPNSFYDAWRESQTAPAWWSLLAWLRRAVEKSQSSWYRRALFSARELLHRLHLAGVLVPAAASVAFLGIATGVFSAYLLARSNKDNQIEALDALLGLAGGAAAVAVTALAVGRVLGRWTTWGTPAGAKLFERRDDNPMADVLRHSSWLRHQASGPIVLVVDDLDRCSAAFAVELLESLQTLLRPDTGSGQPLICVVCADERWLSTAFSRGYDEFSEALSQPGRSMGYLFLAKLFQLQVRVPPLESSDAISFGRRKLRSGAGQDAPMADTTVVGAVKAIEESESVEEIVDHLDRLEEVGDLAPDQLLDGAFAAGYAASSDGVQSGLRHELDSYLPMLDATPRAVIRFINTYAIQRLSATGGSLRPTSGMLARWTVILLRWPAVAQRLTTRPELMEAWHEKGIPDDDPHLQIVSSQEFRDVVLGERDTLELSAEGIKRCLGSLEQSTLDPAADP